MKKIILAIFIFTLAISCRAKQVKQYDNESDFQYVEYGTKGIEIAYYFGNKNEAHIPPLIKNLPVIHIGEYAFSRNEKLTVVTIPDSVISIRNGAFSDCARLTSVTIGNSVTSIGGWVFIDCPRLTDINVDAANTTYSSENGVLYDKTKTTLIACPGGKTGAFTIPNSVTYIRDGAFASCTSLTNITIPDNVTNIGNMVFSHCEKLTGITIPNGITSIGEGAFKYCTSLPNINIPNGVTSIGEQAFNECTGLTGVTIPNSVTSIGERAFEWCPSLTAINVEAANTAYSSANGVLYDKTKTTLITYPGGKTGAFTIPDSITSIERETFLYCENLTNVTIGNRVANIGDQAFFNCANLTDVTFEAGSNITDANFGDDAFPGGDDEENGNNLKYAYAKGKAGTYTRASRGSTWTKR